MRLDIGIDWRIEPEPTARPRAGEIGHLARAITMCMHHACPRQQLEGQLLRKAEGWGELLKRIEKPPTDEAERLAFITNLKCASCVLHACDE